MLDINTSPSSNALKHEGLPERIKVTISREDGSPVFSHDNTAIVEYLTDDAPVMVIRRDGGALETICGNIYSVGEMVQELLERDCGAAGK